jgi:hypothetical protein
VEWVDGWHPALPAGCRNNRSIAQSTRLVPSTLNLGTIAGRGPIGRLIGRGTHPAAHVGFACQGILPLRAHGGHILTSYY